MSERHSVDASPDSNRRLRCLGFGGRKGYEWIREIRGYLRSKGQKNEDIPRMDLHELTAIAEEKLARHGLRGWTFGWARTKRRLGVCKYREKRIEIAEYYALHNPRENVLDTLLHEIAHALAGPKAGHGDAWKAIAERLGATPLACDTSPKTVVMPGDWQATCTACQKTYHRYRRPQSLTGYRCRCAARASLTFHFQGDPARQPIVSQTVPPSVRWEAMCSGCHTVHRRVRKPKNGVWRCGCPHRCQLTWRLHAFRVDHS